MRVLSVLGPCQGLRVVGDATCAPSGAGIDLKGMRRLEGKIPFDGKAECAA